MFYYIYSGTNGRHFADDIFNCIYLNATYSIFCAISPKYVPKGSCGDKSP